MGTIAENLEELIKNSGITKVNLASNTGLTSQTIANILNGSDVKVSSIQKIANYFKVPVGYFFDETTTSQQTTGNSNVTVGRDNNGHISIAECQDKLDDALLEIKHLQEVIEGKDKLLNEKERLINVLMNK